MSDASSEAPKLLARDLRWVELELVRSLLEEAGIPVLAHGPDFDVAELGTAAHANLRGRDLYVPPAAFEKARDLVVDALGEEVLTGGAPSGVDSLVEDPSGEDPSDVDAAGAEPGASEQDA